ncbi:MAG TPA: dTDP-4-dehydrorhamnose reductase [Candidatus Acidoferrales bacterium]|nr:dTDP-4-dehydrorhamnose reductase [Candidatus Acidoferrales bacterium]
MRVLVLGGSGQLGSEIRRLWTSHAIDAPSHDELDVRTTAGVETAVDRFRPDALVNCAAFHNVDRCEETPEPAFEVNALAVERLARVCARRGVHFATISTDYVFSGSATEPYVETDCARPISAYGASKLAGELLVEAVRSDALIVRTCGVYGVRPSSSKGYTFVDRIVGKTRAGERSRVVRDVFASPTFAGDLAAALEFLIERRAGGIYHAADVGPVSWYDFAREAVRRAGLDPEAVEPIASGEWSSGARRPQFSALDSGKLRAFGFSMPTWQEGLSAYLRLSRLSESAPSP